MNALAERVLVVAKEYLGPASQQFLSRELRALGCTADTLAAQHVAALSDRARASALRIMDQTRADEFAAQLAALGSTAPAAEPAHALSKRVGKLEGGSLAAAAQLLADGKLRQAEEAYRQLAARTGDVAAYQGLARSAAALEDVPAALLALRDGATALTRTGDRAGAIRLLAEAAVLAPGDLAAHRRLAAAHANAGDVVSACDEYARFVDHALAEGDQRRAWLELTYGRETLGDVPALLRIADRLMPAGLPAAARPVAPPAPAPPKSIAAPSPDVQRLVPAEPPVIRPVETGDLPRTRPLSTSSAVHLAGASTLTHVEAYDEAPVDLLARTALRGRPDADPPLADRPAVDLEALLATLEPTGAPEQAAAIADVRATVLIGAHDPRATAATLDAARRLLALHKLQAASDLLLDFIGAGYSDREAQRLLIEVDCGIGRRDVARDKCKLLGAAYRLDGHADTAEDVERLAALI